MEPCYEPKQPSFRLPEEKKEVELYDDEGLDETGHKKENSLLKLLHADTDIEVEKNMDMLRFMYFRENPMGMTHAHTHSATIMNRNDKEAYKFLMNKVFSITYIDRVLIVKNYIDNELVKYHPTKLPS